MLKASPFPSLQVFVRVLIKATLIVVMFNGALLLSGFNPIRRLVMVNTWGLVGHGRVRLVYPSDFQNGQLPLEALLGAHQIAYAEKRADEYRVIVLGESGIAGWGLADQETLAAQLTARAIGVEGKRLVAYNLAYPQPSAVRDLLILDAALAYQPDLAIWFITPAAVDNAPEVVGSNRVFFDLNRERLERLSEHYASLLGEWEAGHMAQLLDPEPGWQRYVAIRDQELLPIWLNTLFYPLIVPDLAESERRIGLEDVPAEARYGEDHPGFERMPNETWQFLRAVCQHAQGNGVQLLLVNEPMLVGGGPNSTRNYNGLYERSLYDRYRETLGAFATEHGIWYVDLWNLIPAERYTDTPLHADAEGYAILAAELEKVLTGDQGETRCR